MNNEEIPPRYLVDINSGPISNSRYAPNSYDNVIITVYESLDKSFGSPPIQHIREIGNFSVSNVGEFNGIYFLSQVRRGIEKLIKSK